jgi:hypothetical protein
MLTKKDIGKYVEIDLDVYEGRTIPGSVQDLTYGVLANIKDGKYHLRPSATIPVEMLDMSDIGRHVFRLRGIRVPNRRLVRGKANLIAHLDQNKPLVISQEEVGDNIAVCGDAFFKRTYGIGSTELP